MGENSFAIIAWIKKKYATIISNAKWIKHFFRRLLWQRNIQVQRMRMIVMIL